MSIQTHPLVLDLWPDLDAGPSTEVEFPNAEVDNRRFLRNVNIPTLTVFLPDPAINTRTAMIVCPGGGLHILAIDYEGLEVARWLCERGIAAFVLKYRVIPTPINHDEYHQSFRAIAGTMGRLTELARQHMPIAVADGQQAMSIVRQRAAEWGIQPDQVGMMGFSAGAFVTMMTTLYAEKQHRPNFVASIYGGMWDSVDMDGPRPPLFIALTDDDTFAVEPSLQLYSAWHKAKSPVELHIYAKGEHGFAFRQKNIAAEGWIDRLYEWLQVLELIKR